MTGRSCRCHTGNSLRAPTLHAAQHRLCVCLFVSAPAGWHVCSVNNSSVKPAIDKSVSPPDSDSDFLHLHLPYLFHLSLFLPQQPIITLEGSMACAFSREGISTVTVQVSAGNTILQDRKAIAVHGELALTSSPLGLCSSVNTLTWCLTTVCLIRYR